MQNQLLRGVRGHREGPDALAALENQGPNREIRDAQGLEQVMRGPIVRTEGQPPTGDAAADEAYDGLGATYDFWPAPTGATRSTTRACRSAASCTTGATTTTRSGTAGGWCSGTATGSCSCASPGRCDVIGHELAHGVTEDENGLQYQGQSGALNESCSDVFGSLVKQHALGQTAEQADWLIGADLLGPDVQGSALRSMKAPGTAYDDDVLGKDPQPAHMDDYVDTSEDDGGVHINSGIPNHAFYVAATTLGGNAWERRRARLVRDARATAGCAAPRRSRDFAADHRGGRRAAVRRGGAEEAAVRGGWDAVGVAWS